MDADDHVYWTFGNGIEVFDRAGQSLWSHDTPNVFATSSILGAHGDLFIGSTRKIPAAAILHRIESTFDWPTSDQTFDLAASSGLTYSNVLHDNLSDLAMVTSAATQNLMRVAGSDDLYLIRFSHQWTSEDLITPITTEQETYLDSFNPDFLGYTSLLGLDLKQAKTHHQRFAHFWNSGHPHQSLGTYLSSITCKDTPQHPDNKSGAGNSFPATVLDCCAITGTTGDCHELFGTEPFYNPVDGRYLLPFNHPGYIDAAMAHLRQVLQDQHLSRHIFLDNGRYLSARWPEPQECHACIMSCDIAKDPAACVENCKNDVLDPGEDTTCVDSRDVPAGGPDDGCTSEADQLICYFDRLLDELNAEGYRGILNSTLPYAMGDFIEEERLARFEQAVGDNGLAFEQAWHWNSRACPRYARQELELYRRFLSDDKLVLHYPKYADLGEQLWMAAMGLIVREPGQSLFLSRSAYQGSPIWSAWPALYGDPSPFDDDHDHFSAESPEHLTDYRRQGDWAASRTFEAGRQVSAVGLFHEMQVDIPLKDRICKLLKPETSLRNSSWTINR